MNLSILKQSAAVVFTVVGLALPVGQALADAEGFVEPGRIIEVATPETGVVHKMLVKEGARVKRGEVIAVLDSRLLKASMAVAQARMNASASIEAAQARYEQTRARRERIMELAARGSARPDEVMRAKSEAAIAVAELKGARENQDVAELEYSRLKAQVDRRTIRSPIDGVVIRIVREQGELASAGQSVVAEVAELKTLNVVSHVAEASARSLQSGDSLSVRLADGKKIAGIIGFVSPTVDPRSGTVEVKVQLDNSNGKIRSGLRASLVLGGSNSAETVSSSATPPTSLSTAQN